MNTEVSLNLNELYLIKESLESKIIESLQHDDDDSDKKTWMEIWMKIQSFHEELENEEF